VNRGKKKDLSQQLKVVFLEALKKERNQLSKEEEDIDMADFQIPAQEIKLVDQFLSMFTIVSENSQNEHLDIFLMLKALPNKILEYNLDQSQNFNFKIFQESLIAFQNKDIVSAFDYFDEKNMDRIMGLKQKMDDQRKHLVEVKDVMEVVKDKLQQNEEHFARNK